MNTRQMLEEALAADFDDLVAHQAYADLLAEEDDPRSELIRIHLALEDRGPGDAERKRLGSREQELLTTHASEWLGGLATGWRRVAGRAGDCRIELQRGWVRSLQLLQVTVPLAEGLRSCPLARLLHSLHLNLVGDDHTSEFLLASLLAAPFGKTLATLSVGSRDIDPVTWSDDELAAIVSRCPRLEKLYLTVLPIRISELFHQPLANLRTLHIDGAAEFHLEALAENPTLGNLEELCLEPPNPLDEEAPPPVTLESLRALCRSPHLRSLTRLALRRTFFGDDGVRELIESGLLRRLKTLELVTGMITDEGAGLLAAQPGLGEKEVILRDNAITREWRERLETLGENIYAGEQHEPGTTGYLYEFDME